MIQPLVKPVLIVGAGITGISCARVLQQHGVPLRVVNKGKKIGGRIASRVVRDSGTPFDGRVFDIGASYFTVSDPIFRAEVDEMLKHGIVSEWTDSFHFADSSGILGVKVGPMRYRAPAGIRNVVDYLATTIEVAEGEIDSLEGIDERVALCMPIPQAQRIYPEASSINPCMWEPVISVSMLFDQHYWHEFDGVFINNDFELTWIANDGSRRGDGAPALVAHVQPVLSSHHLTNPQSVIPFAVSAVQRILGFSAFPTWTAAQRWTYAKPVEGTTTSDPLFHLGDVSLAGDSFSDRPRVEAGWISGAALGNALLG